MKKRLTLAVMAVILVFALSACPPPDDNGGNSANDDRGTFVVFDNTQGITEVSVYSDHRRSAADRVAIIHPGWRSCRIRWTPGDAVNFYLSYTIAIRGFAGFSLNHVPPRLEMGQIRVRIDQDVINNIPIRRLDEAVTPEELFSNNSHLLISNESSFPFELLRGTTPLLPNGAASTTVNAGERAVYTEAPGANNYRILVNANEWFFPDMPILEAGYVYLFVFNGRNISLTSTARLQLENLNDPFSPSMVRIRSGTFMRGNPSDSSERLPSIRAFPARPQHQVTISRPFYMSRFVVTQAQFQAVMGFNPSSFTSAVVGQDTSNFPVERVSWFDAIVFSNRLSIRDGLRPAYEMETTTRGVWSTNPDDWGPIPRTIDTRWISVRIVAGSNGYRLPTEAQWEFAARAGTTTQWNTGTRITQEQANFGGMSGLNRTSEVGSFPPNAWGLYDMHGNVWEWVWDDPRRYSSTPQVDPSDDPTWGASRIIVRGGGWNTRSISDMRSYSRYSGSVFFRYNNNGFRVVRPVSD